MGNYENPWKTMEFSGGRPVTERRSRRRWPVINAKSCKMHWKTNKNDAEPLHWRSGGWWSKTIQKTTKCIKNKQNLCKSVAPAIGTVAAAVADNRKQCKQLQNALKNCQNLYKTIAPAIETVAAAVVGNRNSYKKLQNALKNNKINAESLRQRSRRSRRRWLVIENYAKSFKMH